MKQWLLLSAVVGLSLTACAPQEPEHPANAVAISEKDPELASSRTKARASLDEFISKLGDKQNYASGYVKFPMKVVGKEEHIWIEMESYTDGTFKGVLTEDSFYDKAVKAGKEIKVKRDEVEDWMLYDTKYNMTGKFSGEVMEKNKK